MKNHIMINNGTNLWYNWGIYIKNMNYYLNSFIERDSHINRTFESINENQFKEKYKEYYITSENDTYYCVAALQYKEGLIVTTEGQILFYGSKNDFGIFKEVIRQGKSISGYNIEIATVGAKYYNNKLETKTNADNIFITFEKEDVFKISFSKMMYYEFSSIVSKDSDGSYKINAYLTEDENDNYSSTLSLKDYYCRWGTKTDTYLNNMSPKTFNYKTILDESNTDEGFKWNKNEPISHEIIYERKEGNTYIIEEFCIDDIYSIDDGNSFYSISFKNEKEEDKFTNAKIILI